MKFDKDKIFFYITLVLGGYTIYLLTKPKSEKSDKGVENTENWRNDVNQHNRSNFTTPEILGLIYTESSGNPKAEGLAGEKGLMQITEGAEKDVKNVFSWTYYLNPLNLFYSRNLFSPVYNIQVGTEYLRLLFNQTNDKFETLRAYNGGLTGTRQNKNLSVEYAERVLRNAEKFK